MKLPTEEELQAQLLTKITQEQLNTTLAELIKTDPIYRKKRYLAYPMIAKTYGFTLEIPLPKGKGAHYEATDIMNNGQFIKVGEIPKTAYKVVNLRGWIVEISKLGTTKAGDKEKVSFNIADETGTSQRIFIFGAFAKDFTQLAHTKLGMAVDILSIPIRDKDGNVFLRFESGKNSTVITPVKDSSALCALNNVLVSPIGSLTDKQYTNIKGVVMSEPTVMVKTGCKRYHYLSGKEGESIPCDKCNGAPMTVMKHTSARYMFADESGNCLLDVPPWNYPANLSVGQFYIIHGNYNEKNGSFSIASYIPVADVPLSTSSQSTLTQSAQFVMWQTIKDGNAIIGDIRKLVPSMSDEEFAHNISLFIEKGIVTENNGRLTTLWDHWDDVVGLIADTTTVASSESLIEQFCHDDATRTDVPSAEDIAGFTTRYKEAFAKTMPIAPSSGFYSPIKRLFKDSNYPLRPFIQAIIDNKLAVLERQGSVVKLKSIVGQ